MPVEHEPREETTPSDDLPSPPPVKVYACSAPMRLLRVSLQALAGLNLLYVTAAIVHDILAGEQSAPPELVALGLAVFSGVPLGVAWLLGRLGAATVDIQPPLLVLTLRRARFEIPLASIVAVRPWALPLPGPGLALEMTSGRLFRYRLQLADPGALIEALASALPAARSALDHRSVAHARARQRHAQRRLRYWLLKFGLFPFVLAVLLFRVHQYISYGGPFGEYHRFGLAAYLKSFGLAWAGITALLVVYAGIFRLVAETLTFSLTWALPGRARGLRRAAEIFCQLVYFGLVPAYVLFRFLE